MGSFAHSALLVLLVDPGSRLDLVEGRLLDVSDDSEWFVVEEQLEVEGAVELAPSAVRSRSVEIDRIGSQVEGLAETLCADGELGSSLAETGLDAASLGTNLVGSFQDLDSIQKAVRREIDQRLFSVVEFRELPREAGVRFMSQSLLVAGRSRKPA